MATKKQVKDLEQCTVYLVSAVKDGEWHWKIGITHHEDPLKRDRKRYREVHRAVRVSIPVVTRAYVDLQRYEARSWGDDPDVWSYESVGKPFNDKVTARDHALQIENYLKRANGGKEWFNGLLPLDEMVAFFDATVKMVDGLEAYGGGLDSIGPQAAHRRRENRFYQRVCQINEEGKQAKATAMAEMQPMWA